GRAAPEAGQAVGLELHAHRERVGLPRPRLLELTDLPLDAEQVLDVVSELVGDDIRLREFAGRAEPLRELVEELEVEVDLAVGRAIEGPHRALAKAARRLGGTAEKDELGLTVAIAQQLRPG